MVFYFNEALIQDGPQQPDYYLFIQTMMIAYKEGKHVLIISPRNTASLIADPNVDETSKLYLRDYQAHGKEAIGYFKLFKIIIEIIPLNQDENHRTDLDSNLEFRCLHFSKLIDTAHIQKTILLGENGNDSIVYGRIAEYYLRYNNLNLFRVSYKTQTGGGSTLHDEYKRIYEDKEEFCICLVDSDRNAPNASLGDTAKRLWDYHKAISIKIINAKCHCQVLSALELENLFPIEFYKAQYINTHLSETHSRLNILKKASPDAILHHDFKKGLRAFYNQNNHILNEYWMPIIQECELTLNQYEEIDYYLNGFGQQILTNFVAYDVKTLFSHLDECEVLQPIWLELGKIISSFVFAPNRKIAV